MTEQEIYAKCLALGITPAGAASCMAQNYNALNNLPEEFVTTSTIESMTLGINEDDGLVYLYVNGVKQGLGVQFYNSKEIYKQITYILPHATSSNQAIIVPKSAEYITKIVAEKQYELINVIVTMNGIV